MSIQWIGNAVGPERRLDQPDQIDEPHADDEHGHALEQAGAAL